MYGVTLVQPNAVRFSLNYISNRADKLEKAKSLAAQYREQPHHRVLGWSLSVPLKPL